MFDFRYHALSLVAVFLALAVGLLLGVAIGDRGLVSSAEGELRESLRADVVEARQRAEDREEQLAELRRLQEDELYPLNVDDLLRGRRVGVVALGALNEERLREVRAALGPTGAELAYVAVVREPLDPAALAEAVPTRERDLAGLADARDEAVDRLGRRVGDELTGRRRRGEAPLLGRVRAALLRSASGDLGPADAIVLVRSGIPVPRDAAATRAAFERGLVRGLTAGDTPIVGAEATGTTPTQIPWFEARGLTSVDDVDEVTGRLSLVFGLAGARGTFGRKPTAERLLPPTRPSPPAPRGG